MGRGVALEAIVVELRVGWWIGHEWKEVAGWSEVAGDLDYGSSWLVVFDGIMLSVVTVARRIRI